MAAERRKRTRAANGIAWLTGLMAAARGREA
jgi:hypothetical protein